MQSDYKLNFWWNQLEIKLKSSQVRIMGSFTVLPHLMTIYCVNAAYKYKGGTAGLY